MIKYGVNETIVIQIRCETGLFEFI